MPRPSVVPEPARRYAGLSADERRAGRRDRLVQAAVELYGTIGFRKTTIPQLCRAAGVTARHFYDDFPTQESLLSAAYERIANEIIERIRLALEEGDTARPFENFRRGVDAYFTYVTTDKRRARIFALEVIGVSPELDRHRLAMRDRFVTIAARNAERYGYAGGDLDLRLVSLSLVGVTDILLLDWLVATRRRHSVATMVDYVTTIWVRALKMDGPRAKRRVAAPKTATRVSAKGATPRGPAKPTRKPRA